MTPEIIGTSPRYYVKVPLVQCVIALIMGLVLAAPGAETPTAAPSDNVADASHFDGAPDKDGALSNEMVESSGSKSDGSSGESVSWLAAGAAVIPGFLIHGAGHFVTGNTTDASHLLALEGLGIVNLAAAVASLAAFGGSEKFAPVYISTAVAGLSLFGASFIADIIGTLRGQRPWPEPQRTYGRLSLRVGYAGLFGSMHTFRHLGHFSADWHGRRWSGGVRITGQPTSNSAYSEFGATIGWPLWAPENGEAVTKLTLVADLGRQRFRSENFSMTTFRGFGELRWNMGDFVSTMRNAWLLGRLGWGFDAIDFASAAKGDDGLPFLVAEGGMGLMATESVSLEAIYLQRKGLLPGGLMSPPNLAGFFGMIELRARVALNERWHIVPELRIGRGVMSWLCFETSFL